MTDDLGKDLSKNQKLALLALTGQGTARHFGFVAQEVSYFSHQMSWEEAREILEGLADRGYVKRMGAGYLLTPEGAKAVEGLTFPKKEGTSSN